MFIDFHLVIRHQFIDLYWQYERDDEWDINSSTFNLNKNWDDYNYRQHWQWLKDAYKQSSQCSQKYDLYDDEIPF